VHGLGMQGVATRYLDDHACDQDHHEALWTLPALEPLLFTLTHDGSVRMRRAAMEAARTVVVRHCTLTAPACSRKSIFPRHVLQHGCRAW
jgi:ribosomal protein L16/L10AE